MIFKTQYNFDPLDASNFEKTVGPSLTEEYPNHPWTIKEILERSQVDPDAIRGSEGVYLDSDFDDMTLNDFKLMDEMQLMGVKAELEADYSKIQLLIEEKQAEKAALAEQPKEPTA